MRSEGWQCTHLQASSRWQLPLKKSRHGSLGIEPTEEEAAEDEISGETAADGQIEAPSGEGAEMAGVEGAESRGTAEIGVEGAETDEGSPETAEIAVAAAVELEEEFEAQTEDGARAEDGSATASMAEAAEEFERECEGADRRAALGQDLH